MLEAAWRRPAPPSKVVWAVRNDGAEAARRLARASVERLEGCVARLLDVSKDRGGGRNKTRGECVARREVGVREREPRSLGRLIRPAHVNDETANV